METELLLSVPLRGDGAEEQLLHGNGVVSPTDPQGLRGWEAAPFAFPACPVQPVCGHVTPQGAALPSLLNAGLCSPCSSFLPLV